MDSAEVHSIVSTVERHLQLQVVLVVNRRVGHFTNKLGGVSMSVGLFVGLLVSLDILDALNVVTQLQHVG